MSLFLKDDTYCTFANVHILLKFLNLILVITFSKAVALLLSFLQILAVT